MCLLYDIGFVDDYFLIIVMFEIVNLMEIFVFLKYLEFSFLRLYEIFEL